MNLGYLLGGLVVVALLLVAFLVAVQVISAAGGFQAGWGDVAMIVVIGVGVALFFALFG